MQRTMILALLGAFLLSLAAAQFVWSKAHVPLGLVQVCNQNGVARNVTPKRAVRLIAEKNACRLPACAFNLVDGSGNVIQQTVFVPGSACDNVDVNEDGFCDASGTPGDVSPDRDARDLTQACSDSF